MNLRPYTLGKQPVGIVQRLFDGEMFFQRDLALHSPLPVVAAMMHGYAAGG